MAASTSRAMPGVTRIRLVGSVLSKEPAARPHGRGLGRIPTANALSWPDRNRLHRPKRASVDVAVIPLNRDSVSRS